MRPADVPLPLLQARELICRRELMAFGPLSFELHRGQLLLIKGANGSGKSSLLRILTGLLTATEGFVYWLNVDIRRDAPTYAKSLTYLGHSNGLSGDLTAHENLHFGLQIAGIKTHETALTLALAFWGLQTVADTPARKLSQGQARRLALARVMLSARQLWLLDEPDAGLDAENQARLNKAIHTHLQSGGAAVVASHHPVADLAGCTQHMDMDDYADICVADANWTA